MTEKIHFTPEETALINSVKELFESKSDYCEGADFRMAFIKEVMDGYCEVCGSSEEDGQCYCWNDD